MKDDMFKANIKKTSLALVGVATYSCGHRSTTSRIRLSSPFGTVCSGPEEFDGAMASLKVKKEELRIVDEKLAKQKAHLDQVKADKQALEDKVADTDTKLTRAKKLIEGLGGEKARYMVNSPATTEIYTFVVGDVVISAGVVAYLGPFLNKNIVNKPSRWMEMCKKLLAVPTREKVRQPHQHSRLEVAALLRIASLSTMPLSCNSARWPLLVIRSKPTSGSGTWACQ